jgi:long-chain acyl-CoA synthetase
MTETIPRLLDEIAKQYPEHVAQYAKDRNGAFHPTTFAKLREEVRTVACGFLDLGIKRGDHVGLISDNRKEWFLVDLALLAIGAADVPRGCDSVASELSYILAFSECEIVVVENLEQLRKVAGVEEAIPKMGTIVVLQDDYLDAQLDDIPKRLTVLRLSQIVERGVTFASREPDRYDREVEAGAADDCATIIFTSGTTGEPKGVMLSHRNFLHQVEHVPLLITVGPGDRWLSVLPVWHSFERIMQYVALGSASALSYSKPIAKILIEDFAKIRPTWMASVPRIWESLQSSILRNIRSQGGVKSALFHFFVAVGGAHEAAKNLVRGTVPEFRKRMRVLDIAAGIVPYLLLAPLRSLGNALVFSKIRERLGGKFVAGISGGGALPPAVDRFFSAAGILLLEGYGLTESAPVLSLRLQRRPVPGTIGPAFPGTEIKIIDEAGNPVAPGIMGELIARGPQVMLGYFRKPELTKQVIDADGFLHTGDLAMMTRRGEIRIVGRAKDTIVLLGGENVEPLPIEQKLTESPYIRTAVLLGQDKKYLAALILPDRENCAQFAAENGVSYTSEEELFEQAAIVDLIGAQIKELVSARNGFKAFERVFRFKLIDVEFEVGRELSAKQEIKRHAIAEIYRNEIKRLFD